MCLYAVQIYLSASQIYMLDEILEYCYYWKTHWQLWILCLQYQTFSPGMVTALSPLPCTTTYFRAAICPPLQPFCSKFTWLGQIQLPLPLIYSTQNPVGVSHTSQEVFVKNYILSSACAELIKAMEGKTTESSFTQWISLFLTPES